MTNTNIHFHPRPNSEIETRLATHNHAEPLEFHSLRIRMDNSEATYFFTTVEQTEKFFDSLLNSYAEWKKNLQSLAENNELWV